MPDDPQVVMAVAAVASAVIAVGSLVFGIVRASRAQREAEEARQQALEARQAAQEAREEAARAQWKMAESLGVIAHAQKKSVEREEEDVRSGRLEPTAEEVEAAQGFQDRMVALRTILEGTVSARVEKPSQGAERLIVANVGGITVRLLEVDVDPGDVVVRGEWVPERGVELLPGEDLTMPLALSLATPPMLRVAMKWENSEGETQQREQQVPTT